MLTFARTLVLFSCALVFASSSFAQRLRFGPNNISVTVNGISAAANLKGSAVIDSANGDANVDGEIIVYSKLADLESSAKAIADSLLPHDIKGSPCTITVDRLNSLKLIYPRASYELRIVGSLSSSLHCGIINPSADVAIDLSLQPSVANKTTLSWKIVRKPEIQIPWSWQIAMEIAQGDPSRLFLEKAQAFLDQHATFNLPAMPGGIDATFKGANFDFQQDIFQFRVKGDAHAGPASLTRLLQIYLDATPLEFTFQLPQQD